MKVFIIHPMDGKTRQEIIAERTEISCHLKETYGADTQVLETWLNEDDPQDEFHELLLEKSLLVIERADAAFLCSGWEAARTCRVQQEKADECGLELIEDYRDEIEN